VGSLHDNDGNYRGIEWIDVNKGKVVAVESAMRAQLFRSISASSSASL